MRVGVFGASGFLGSWICRVLSEDHYVSAILRTTSSEFRLQNIDNISIRRINDSQLENFFNSFDFDVLILCDWEGVSNVERNKPEQLENVERQLHVAKLAIAAGIKSIVGIGSQAELGPTYGPISDSHKDGATTSYGKAKIAARLALQEVSELTQTRFIWLRVFSTYGPLDTGNWLIPQVVDSILAGREILLTKCEQNWNYLHAYDLARAVKFVIEDSGSSGVFNVGDLQTVKLKKLMKYIGEVLDAEDLLKFGVIEYRHDQVMELNPRCEKLVGLGWEPLISLNEGINQTIIWLKGEEQKPVLNKYSHELFFSLPNRS